MASNLPDFSSAGRSKPSLTELKQINDSLRFNLARATESLLTLAREYEQTALKAAKTQIASNSTEAQRTLRPETGRLTQTPPQQPKVALTRAESPFRRAASPKPSSRSSSPLTRTVSPSSSLPRSESPYRLSSIRAGSPSRRPSPTQHTPGQGTPGTSHRSLFLPVRAQSRRNSHDECPAPTGVSAPEREDNSNDPQRLLEQDLVDSSRLERENETLRLNLARTTEALICLANEYVKATTAAEEAAKKAAEAVQADPTPVPDTAPPPSPSNARGRAVHRRQLSRAARQQALAASGEPGALPPAITRSVSAPSTQALLTSIALSSAASTSESSPYLSPRTIGITTVGNSSSAVAVPSLPVSLLHAQSPLLNAGSSVMSPPAHETPPRVLPTSIAPNSQTPPVSMSISTSSTFPITTRSSRPTAAAFASPPNQHATLTLAGYPFKPHPPHVPQTHLTSTPPQPSSQHPLPSAAGTTSPAASAYPVLSGNLQPTPPASQQHSNSATALTGHSVTVTSPRGSRTRAPIAWGETTTSTQFLPNTPGVRVSPNHSPLFRPVVSPSVVASAPLEAIPRVPLFHPSPHAPGRSVTMEGRRLSGSLAVPDTVSSATSPLQHAVTSPSFTSLPLLSLSASSGSSFSSFATPPRPVSDSQLTLGSPSPHLPLPRTHGDLQQEIERARATLDYAEAERLNSQSVLLNLRAQMQEALKRSPASKPQASPGLSGSTGPSLPPLNL